MEEKLKNLIEELKRIKRYSMSGDIFGTSNASEDDMGSWVSFEDLVEIIEKYKQ